MRTTGTVLLIAAAALAWGCGRPPVDATGGDIDPGDAGSKAPVVTAPSLHLASPSRLAVGDTLFVYGKGFLPRKQGRVELRFQGTYSTGGANQHVNLMVYPVVVNSGQLRWVLWPGVVFDSGGDRPGIFSGAIYATNRPRTGKALTSKPRPVTLYILPSLVPGVRAHGASCSDPVTRTVREKTSMRLSVTAAGLKPGTKAAPLVFTWTLPVGPWTMRFAHQGAALIPSAGTNVVIRDRVTSGLTSTLAPDGKGKLQVRLGKIVYNEAVITDLKTGVVPHKDVVRSIPVSVTVSDAAGKTIRLAFTLEARRKYDAVYSGKVRLRERFQPRPVTDCIPGGDIGRVVTYFEDKSETKGRSMSFNYNASPGGEVLAPTNPWMLGIDFSARFGFDVSGTVSSSKAKVKDITPHPAGMILPGEWGMFYRQTLKLEHSAPIYLTTACGRMIQLGYALVTDWRWEAELARGASCPPSPSKLPKAQKYF